MFEIMVQGGVFPATYPNSARMALGWPTGLCVRLPHTHTHTHTGRWAMQHRDNINQDGWDQENIGTTLLSFQEVSSTAGATGKVTRDKGSKIALPFVCFQQYISHELENGINSAMNLPGTIKTGTAATALVKTSSLLPIQEGIGRDRGRGRGRGGGRTMVMGRPTL